MLGANAFKNGHDTKLIDIAVEAVKGNAGADNKPVTKTVNGVTTVTYFDDDQKRISTRTPAVRSDAIKDSIVSTKGVVDSVFVEFVHLFRLYLKKEGRGDYIYEKDIEK